MYRLIILLGALLMVSGNPIFGTVISEYEHETNENTSLRLLLQRLDIEKLPKEFQLPVIDEERSNADVLLNYFRTRDNVRHPIRREDRKVSKGITASKADLKIAEDALQHIFVGQPAYPGFFCGEDIDWGFRPVPDNEWVWQLNRMSFWDSMARAYWHTGDEKYAKGWAVQMMDW